MDILQWQNTAMYGPDIILTEAGISSDLRGE
jgi:hypothetical protein